MNAGRASQILHALTRGQIAASPAEHDELAALGLVELIDERRLKDVQRVESCADHAHPRVDGDAMFLEDWVVKELSELEPKLASDLHRATHTRDTLWREEQRRAELRSTRGLLHDGPTNAMLREIVRRRRTWATRPQLTGRPHELVVLSRFGREVLAGMRPRIARIAEVPLRTYLARREKAEAKLDEIVQSATVMRRHLAQMGVQRGWHHVVGGLVKSSYEPGPALASFGAAMARLEGTPAKERAGLATAAVRAASERGSSADGAVVRIGQYTDLLTRVGYPPGELTRNAAKALVTAPDPDAALQRLNQLVGSLRQLGFPNDGALKAATRLFGAKGTAADVLARVARALQDIARAGHLTLPAAQRDAAVAVAASTDSVPGVDAALRHAFDIAQAFGSTELPPTCDPWALGLACVGIPSPPSEIVALVMEGAWRLANGTPTLEHVQLACGLARKYAY